MDKLRRSLNLVGFMMLAAAFAAGCGEKTVEKATCIALGEEGTTHDTPCLIVHKEKRNGTCVDITRSEIRDGIFTLSFPKQEVDCETHEPLDDDDGTDGDMKSAAISSSSQ